MSATRPKQHQCPGCQKTFVTKDAKFQHLHAKHLGLTRARSAGTNESPLPMQYLYRGIVYSPAVEQSTIQGQLSNLCHSEERLRQEGYILPTTASTDAALNMSLPSPRVDPPCPDKNPSSPKHAALVIDCEMGGTKEGENEVIKVTIADFFSGDILLNRIVNPSRPIVDWRTNVTGIQSLDLTIAAHYGQLLNGWEGARDELWRLSDKETIIIGQSVQKDLHVLHTSHARIIDSAIITADAVLGKKAIKRRHRWGLETLCKELLGIQIRSQSGLARGGEVHHDALEDVLATREVVLFCAQKPNDLKTWARKAEAAFWKGNGKTRGKPRGGRGQSGGPPRQTATLRRERSEEGHDDENEESLRWEDVVDWDTWPKSPPDSD